SIEIPDSVTSIGNNAFYGASNLKSIYIPTKEENKIKGAPWGASDAKVYWKGIINLDPFIFDIEKRTILEYIGKETEVEIPSEFIVGDQVYGVEHIGQNAFRDNRTITSIEIPDSVTTIEDYAFKGTSSLTNVTLGKGITIIRRFAFSNSGITSIEIPDSVTTIERYAFNGTSSLTNVTLGNGLETIGNSAFENSGITSIEIPDSVTTIEDYAFNIASSLKNVTLGKGVTTIGNYAFSNSGITSIEIPDSVTSIGSNAFKGAVNLEEVTIGKGITNISNDAFSNTPKLKLIKVNIVRLNAPEGVTNTQPWGAAGAKVLYIGEFVAFTHSTEVVKNEYARIIDISAEVKNGAISRITLPDNTIISVGGKEWTYKYKVTTNGTYKFKGVDSNGVENEYEVVVSDIGKPTLTANDVKIDVSDIPNLTEDSLKNLVNAKATTQEFGEDFSGGSITIEEKELEKVKALTTHGEKTTITINAISPTGLTAEITVSVEATSIRTVTFDTNLGTPIQPIQIATGNTVTKPQDPTREGYTFDGWYTDNTFAREWDFANDKMPANNITLYAKWNINSYGVDYDSQGGSAVSGEVVEFDSLLTKPQDPTREGYTFAGWYTDDTFATAWNFDSDKM
ncbi:MAG: leucine-rich repeat protein, partial [Clostridium paraputrificum]